MADMNDYNPAPGPMPDNPYVPPNRTPGLAVASMVLGIVSIVFSCCVWIGFVCSVLAIIFGILTLRKGPEGKSMAIAGIICGGVSIVLSVFVLIFWGTANYLSNLGDLDMFEHYWD